MFLILMAVLTASAAPSWGSGLLLQGVRPGLVVERVVPVWEPPTKHRAVLVTPTLSGWWHPGHYVPVQAHVHLGVREGQRWFTESSVGLGATYALNARRTVRIDDEGALRNVPLAGTLVASPMLGLAVGKAGEQVHTLARCRVGLWLPWQGLFAPTWNLEFVMRWGGR